MSYLIVGLGNPGSEYEKTRHNVGRMMIEALAKKNDFPDFATEKRLKALTTTGKIGKQKVQLLEPEPFMNNSGVSISPLIKTKKAAAELVVIHDDLDIPLGKFKISFNKSSGGHKGVESVIKAVKTSEFIRVRVGVTPALASGKLKKPQGEAELLKFIVGEFKKPEAEIIKKLSKKVVEALESIVLDGREIAMGKFN